MGCRSLALVLLVCISVGIVSAATDRVVCYLGTWSVYRHGNGKFTVDDIDPNLCDYLIYGFVGLQESDGSVVHLDEYLDKDAGNFRKFNALKERNPNLKTLLAIGGWNQGSARYSKVVADPVRRANFIRSALSLVQAYGFDGFDLDWEYPGQRDGVPADKQNFVTLIREFRALFDQQQPRLLLTAAVAASGNSVDLSYDVPALSKYLDLINVMAYDLHGPWETVTGQNAPLYASSSRDRTEKDRLLNVDSAIRGWLQRGADPQKIALGLGVYGRSFTLSSPNSNGLGVQISAAGIGGPFTQESGMLGYNEICDSVRQEGWTTVWDDEQKVPYSYKGNQWVGYDNPRSIAIKVEYAKSLNLGAVMIWSIETDDFRGLCGPKYPILRAIRTALGGTSNENLNPAPAPAPVQSSSSSTSTSTTTTTTAAPNSGSGSDSGSVCSKIGYVRDPEDCNVFYYCLHHNGEFVPLKQKCNPGLVFNSALVTCDYPHNVNCG